MKYIIENKEQFRQYQEAFRQLSRAKMATSEDHVLYNLMRGRDLKNGFTPLTNEKKINAHYAKSPWRNFDAALNSLKSSIKHRAHSKDWYEKYGKDTTPPFCMRYGETITEQQWEEILVALGAYNG